jgi:PTS system ascorbate-specific IIB component
MTVKILAVCGMGVGSSLLLLMNAQKALKQLGVEADLDQSDIGLARSASGGYDLILTTAELAQLLGGVKPPVVTITNFISVQEMVDKLGAAMRAMGALE